VCASAQALFNATKDEYARTVASLSSLIGIPIVEVMLGILKLESRDAEIV